MSVEAMLAITASFDCAKRTCMLRTVKRIFWLLVLALGSQSVFGYALLGPFPSGTGVPDGYQQQVITYQTPADVGGPKNLGEEYRRNIPVIYYTMDANFFDYFGSNGAVAIDQAFAVFNALTN